MRRLSCQIPKTHCGITWPTGQISTTWMNTIFKNMLTCHKWQIVLHQWHSLASGAECSGDDSFRVSLQSAGAAGYRSDPKHGLRLVNNWQDLLCLYSKSFNTGAQIGHHLSLSTHKKCQWYRFILWEDKDKMMKFMLINPTINCRTKATISHTCFWLFV